jgi:hypothetical protein
LGQEADFRNIATVALGPVTSVEAGGPGCTTTWESVGIGDAGRLSGGPQPIWHGLHSEHTVMGRDMRDDRAFEKLGYKSLENKFHARMAKCFIKLVILMMTLKGCVKTKRGELGREGS